MVISRVSAAAIIAGLGVQAAAQSATVSVSHDDPDGVVDPGQVVSVRVSVSWGGLGARAGIAGNLLPAPAVGSSANPATPFGLGSSVNPGTPSSGGLIGLAIIGDQQGQFASFDWTAPAGYLGPVVFAFTPSAAHPNVRVYPSPVLPAFVEVQTTYVPVSLTVVPAAGTIVGLLVAGAIATGRRR